MCGFYGGLDVCELNRMMDSSKAPSRLSYLLVTKTAHLFICQLICSDQSVEMVCMVLLKEGSEMPVSANHPGML